MSYLLDAIRKAEKQRNEETVPSLEGLVEERRAKAGRSRGRGLIILVVAAAIAVYAYFNQAQVLHWWGQAKGTAAGLTNQVSGLWRGESDGSSTDADQSESSPAQSATSSSASAITDAQRALISQIAFTVLSYSADEDKRFVMVGSQVLREGETLEGFRILRIQQDGVVISVNGKSVLVRP